MFDFDLDASGLRPIPEIEITDEDLRQLPPQAPLEVIEITDDDLARFGAVKEDLLIISLEDLLAARPQVIDISLDDLPPLPEIIEITLADIRGYLTNQTTDCFHGTSLAAARKIRDEGFRVGGGSLYGSGIYFSVGGVSIARGYAKGSQPCIVHARVYWGKVAYLDDKKIPPAFHGSGDSPTQAALKAGYHSFISTPKYSTQSPAVGIVLQTKGKYVKPPRIEIIELLNPKGKQIE